jgi:hypothetical protein
MIGAMLVFYALRQYHRKGFAHGAAALLLAISFGGSLAILFHQAGRASFAAFLMTLPLIAVIQQNHVRRSHVVLGAIVLVGLVLFGKTFFRPTDLLSERAIGGSPTELARSFSREFTFPIVTLANAILSVPALIEWRWFYDFPLSVIYLIPQRLTGLIHEPTITMLNTAIYRADGGIPVDLLSLGYFSLFIPGVLLAAGGMGALLGLGERLLPSGPDPLMAALRVSWMVLIAFRVMYADPQLFWQPGLYLIITTTAIALPRALGRLLGKLRSSVANTNTSPLGAG